MHNGLFSGCAFCGNRMNAKVSEHMNHPLELSKVIRVIKKALNVLKVVQLATVGTCLQALKPM